MAVNAQGTPSGRFTLLPEIFDATSKNSVFESHLDCSTDWIGLWQANAWFDEAVISTSYMCNITASHHA